MQRSPKEPVQLQQSPEKPAQPFTAASAIGDQRVEVTPGQNDVTLFLARRPVDLVGVVGSASSEEEMTTGGGSTNDCGAV